MERDDIGGKFFHRTEEWDWLTRDTIHVIDSKSPRMITMDPWPQRIYLDADGQRTVEEYIRSIRSLYPRGSAPGDLPAMVIDEILNLAEREGIIALTDGPVDLPSRVRDPRTPSMPVEMSGTWQGSYEHDLPGMPTVNFVMDVDHVQGARFSGTVKDDEAMGGTPGIGKVVGKVVGNGVLFTKQMPIRCEWDERGRPIVDPARTHRRLYYAGEFASGNQRLYGTWRFNDGWMWRGLIPYRVSYGTGRWSMYKVNDEDTARHLAGTSSIQFS